MGGPGVRVLDRVPASASSRRHCTPCAELADSAIAAAPPSPRPARLGSRPITLARHLPLRRARPTTFRYRAVPGLNVANTTTPSSAGRYRATTARGPHEALGRDDRRKRPPTRQSRVIQDQDQLARARMDHSGSTRAAPKQRITFGTLQVHNGQKPTGGLPTFPQVNRLLTLCARRDSNSQPSDP